MSSESGKPKTGNNNNSKIRIGCAGWSYPDWKTVFYPESLDASEQLKFYSKFFNFVEVNSTFYNLPSEETIKNWRTVTPDDFRFSVKLSQNITHKKLPNMEESVIEFFNRIKILETKTFVILVQFPPYFKYSEDNLSHLNYMLKSMHFSQYVAIEFRDPSWFTAESLGKFNGIFDGVTMDPKRFDGMNRNPKRIGFCTSYILGQTPYYSDSQPFQYIRLIGDRSLTAFNKSQRKLTTIWDDLVSKVKNFRENVEITDIFVIFNNHFEGFSPGNIEELKKRLGIKFKPFSSQKDLTGFLK